MPVSPRTRRQSQASKPDSESKRKAKPKGPRPVAMGDWAPKFILALMNGSSVRDASAEAGIDVTLPYKRRINDEEFRRAWKEASDIGTESLEQEAARRAYHGTLKPVFHKGTICGYERQYSDTLLIFLLKGRKPEVYRDGIEEGAARGSFVLNVNIVNTDQNDDAAIEIDQPVIDVVAVSADSNQQDD